MAGSFGIGLGSFLSGAVQGAQAYAGIQDARSRNKLNELRVKEAEGDLAEKTRLQDIDADANRQKQVGLMQAEQAYPDNITKQMEHYTQNTIPQIQKHYIQNGQDDRAQVLGKFVETEQGKTLTRKAAAAINASFMNDDNALMSSMNDTLNFASTTIGIPKYEVTSITGITDDKGNSTGGRLIKFKDQSGKEQEMSFKSSEDLARFLNRTAMPHGVVETFAQEEASAQKQRAENAKKKTEWEQKVAEKGLEFKYNTARDENQSSLRQAEQKAASGFRIQEQTNKAQLDAAYGTGKSANSPVAKAEATIELLRKYGVPEEYIQQNLTVIAGLENKTRPMASRIDDYVKMRSGADLKFGQMAPEKQIAEARKYIAAVDQQNGSASSGTTDNPFQGGGTSTPATQGGKGLTPYYDTQAGKIIYR